MSRYIDVPFRTDPLQDWQLVLEFTHVLVVARSAKCTRMQWTYRIFARYVTWDGFCTRWMSFGNQEIKWQLSSCLQHCSVNWDPCDIASCYDNWWQKTCNRIEKHKQLPLLSLWWAFVRDFIASKNPKRQWISRDFSLNCICICCLNVV